MISLYTILAILFVHWVADFITQTHEQAIGKSSNNKLLTQHVYYYTVTFFVVSSLFCAYQNHIGHVTASQLGINWTIVFFFPITFICHWITDYFTSRLNSKLWAKGDVHNFFVSVGFDQFLHVAQLLLTYQLLK